MNAAPTRTARGTWTVLLAVILTVTGCATAPTPHPATALDPKPRHETGMASYYANRFAGRRTASGETYDPAEMTAAHRTLPFGTRVRVTNLVNERTVDVRINDRGPFRRGRVIDLSRRAAGELGFLSRGLTRVRVEILR